MPIDSAYVAPRAEPLQLAAGQDAQNVQFGYPVASIAVNNNTEYFAKVVPSNRPGFWVYPYQVGTIVNLYPPANSISVTQDLHGPTGVSGAISSNGQGTIDFLLFDAPQSPQAGIIQSPDPLYLIGWITNDMVANWGGSITALTPPAGFNAVLRKLSATFQSPVAGSLPLSRIDVGWEELPPPDPPAQPFSWYQSLRYQSITESFDGVSAVIHNGGTLQMYASCDEVGYYTNAGLTVIVLGEIEYYLVIA